MGKLIEKKSISYQPVMCRFGRFGVTEGKYVNRTLIKCLTPVIADDSDVGYEEVPLEIALNGVDYVSNEEQPFTFKGPDAGRMIWVYILIVIFTALLIILLGVLIATFWKEVTKTGHVSTAGILPHTDQNKPKYYKNSYKEDNQD